MQQPISYHNAPVRWCVNYVDSIFEKGFFQEWKVIKDDVDSHELVFGIIQETGKVKVIPAGDLQFTQFEQKLDP